MKFMFGKFANVFVTVLSFAVFAFAETEKTALKLNREI